MNEGSVETELDKAYPPNGGMSAFSFVFFWMTVTDAIDCMGGDYGPDVTVQAALDFVQRHEDARVFLVVLEDRLRPLLEGKSS